MAASFRMRRPARLAVALLVISALQGIPSYGAGRSKTPAPAASTELDRLNADLETLSRRVSPAVVEVFVTSLVPAQDQAAGGLLVPQRASGSGVLVDPGGYIITNAHVIRAARRIQVQLAEPRPAGPGHSIVRPSGPRKEATLVGRDLEADIAVIKIEGTNLPHLPFGDSEQLRQGQVVLAFGSPLGLEGSVSMGVISATVRQIEPDSPMIYLQTDASIRPGNSGGPLVDVHGAVVGINTFIIDPPAGDAVGFAAPSNIVAPVYRQIREHGRVRRGTIGVRGQTITPELARGLGLDRDWGVILADVYPGSPADHAGLKPGDVVTTLGGKVMENGRQLEVNLYQRAAGEEVVLEYLRDGVPGTARVRLTDRPGDVDYLASLARPEDLVAALQILAVTVDATIVSMVPMRQPWGVLVAASTRDVSPGGAPLLPGDVIRSINGTSVRSLDDLRRGLTQSPRGGWITLHVERQGRMIYVPCEVP
jgi:serine protease Do